MSLPVGLVILSDDHRDAPPLSAVGTVSKDDGWDHGAYEIGHDESFHLGAEWIDRPYFTGNPTADWLAAKVRRSHKDGALTQLGNEQNHPVERFQGTPDDWFVLHSETCSRLTQDERDGVIAMPPSPGFDGWQRWVNRAARKHAVHCYGDRQLMQATVQWFLDNTAADLYVTECNPGAGNTFDLNAWATQHFRPFLEWCDQQPRVRAVLYFAWKWNESAKLPSSVDAAGSAVATVLRQWVKEASNGAVDRSPIPRPDGAAQPAVAAGVRPDSGAGDADPGGRGTEERGVDAAVPQEAVVIKGIDISNNNGHVDLARVKAAGYEFVFCKTSEDGLGDDDFYDGYLTENWRSAGELELARGVYHFARPSNSPPADSVTVLRTALERVGGLRSGDLLALDIEDEKYDGDLLVWVAEWCAEAERQFGVPPIVYSGHWYLGPHNLEGHAPSLGRYPLWYASYQGEEPSPPAGWDRITIWQNGCHANVPGVTGECDTDLFAGTVAELRALGLPSGEADAAPAPAPLVDPIDDAFNDLFDLTLQSEPQSEQRRRDAQEAISVLKKALGREAA